MIFLPFRIVGKLAGSVFLVFPRLLLWRASMLNTVQNATMHPDVIPAVFR